MGSSGAAVMRFDLPFTAGPPPLVSEEAGITSLMERRSSSHAIDVTILDTADNRLLRAGILLAHRVLDGLGSWYLAAPAWRPHLPAEHVSPVGAAAELPDDLVAWTRPFVRRAAVGPVAGLDCQRSEYLLRGDGRVLGVIRDEKVTVRRGGVATARYREATITPSSRFTGRQRDFILGAMDSIAATHVTEFPSLQQRLGPPATGGTDFPDILRFRRRDVTLESFVTAVFAADLRALVTAWFTGAEELAAVLRDIHAHARGLASVLDPSWLRGLEEAVATEVAPRAQALDAIDLLVGAVRAPRLGDASREPAAALLLDRAEHGAHILAERCRTLGPDSSDQDWAAARAAADQVQASGAVAVRLHGKAGRQLMARLDEVDAALRRCAVTVPGPELAGLSVEEAFELGRQAERESQGTIAEREAFVAAWPERLEEFRRLLRKVKR